MGTMENRRPYPTERQNEAIYKYDADGFLKPDSHTLEIIAECVDDIGPLAVLEALIAKCHTIEANDNPPCVPSFSAFVRLLIDASQWARWEHFQKDWVVNETEKGDE